MINIFEEFLEEKFLELFPGVLDDDIADRYDGWLGNLDGEEYIVFADEFRRVTIEKLIAEIPNHAEGFGQYCDTGEDMDWSCRSECTEEAVNRLRAKWLGNKN
jgi:hypothetical protein